MPRRPIFIRQNSIRISEKSPDIEIGFIEPSRTTEVTLIEDNQINLFMN